MYFGTLILTAHKLQKTKMRFLTCHCYKIDRLEAVGLLIPIMPYDLEITIFVDMRNLDQFLENLIFC